MLGQEPAHVQSEKAWSMETAERVRGQRPPSCACPPATPSLASTRNPAAAKPVLALMRACTCPPWQGEMSATVMRFPRQWAALIAPLRKLIGPLAVVKFGVGLNWNRLGERAHRFTGFD